MIFTLPPDIPDRLKPYVEKALSVDRNENIQYLFPEYLIKNWMVKYIEKHKNSNIDIKFIYSYFHEIFDTISEEFVTSINAEDEIDLVIKTLRYREDRVELEKYVEVFCNWATENNITIVWKKYS